MSKDRKEDGKTDEDDRGRGNGLENHNLKESRLRTCESRKRCVRGGFTSVDEGTEIYERYLLPLRF